MSITLMQHFEKITEFLGLVLDDNCEIALLDLQEGRQCITAIAHGHNSGRDVGAPITDLALKIILQGTWKDTPFLCNYSGLSGNNQPLISSSYFIKEDNQLLGMLCINIAPRQDQDLEQIYRQLTQVLKNMEPMLRHSQEIGANTDLQENFQSETFNATLAEMFQHTISTCLGDSHVPMERLTQEEKIKIVEQLNENGFFRIKGSVSELSLRLNCSEATIYRYLSKISKQKKATSE